MGMICLIKTFIDLIYLCHLYSSFPLFFLSLLLELKSTQSGRWIAYRQKTLVTWGFSMTCIWHNLPWAISLGMTNAVCLWKPIKRFFKKTETAPSALSASTWADLLFARLSRKIRKRQKRTWRWQTVGEVLCVCATWACVCVYLDTRGRCGPSVLKGSSP